VSGFESILDQKKPIRLLTALFQNNTIPQALLFSGIDGVGKKTCAIVFAMLCNCRQPVPFTADGAGSGNFLNPCGSCRSCVKIQSGGHPDVILIKPSGPYIRIEQIRKLCHTLAMKPFEARLRVVIISDAHAMTAGAGNALLKMLEEPPDRTMFMLTAIQVSDLLPTVASRCQYIRFNPISSKRLSTILVSKQGLDYDNAVKIAAMANGSIAKALLMINPTRQTSWINIRLWLIKITSQIIVSDLSTGLLLAFAAKLAKNKGILIDSLEVIKSWLRDIVVYRYNLEKVINQDLIDMIRSASQQITVKSALSKIKAIQTAQKNIQANTNLRLTLELLVIKLARA